MTRSDGHPLKIAMIGTGYVGLVSGVCFAEIGANVVCVDKNQGKIDTLLKGNIPIYEPGLSELLIKNKERQQIQFTTNLDEAVSQADVVFIAVGTPTSPESGEADLSYVFKAAEEIGNALDGYTVVVTKSTVPVGTNKKVKDIIAKATCQNFDVASNPEFLREGSAVYDFMNPERVIIGTDSPQARELLTRLYDPLCDEGVPRLRTTLETAELIKYGANAFLAAKIMFINEIANLCEATGANIREVAKGMGMDQRIGRSFLNTGPGYGGSCFPKDTLALNLTGKSYGVDLTIVEQVIRSNAERKSEMARRILTKIKPGETLGVLGLSFKANTDDTRESPAVEICQQLLDQGVKLKAYDPKAHLDKDQLQGDFTRVEDPTEVGKDASGLAILTEWAEFKALDFQAIHGKMKKTDFPSLFDFRNLLDPEVQNLQGFEYHSLGSQKMKITSSQPLTLAG